MRPPRFGAVALVLVFVYCAAIALRAFYRTPAPPLMKPARVVTNNDVATAKRDLCRIARAEHAFYSATGHYADDFELRANGDSTLPPRESVPYLYSIRVPVPERFVIVATAYGPLQQHPPALVVDDRLQLCVVRSDLPNLSRQLDNPPQRWGHTSYDCRQCE